MSLVKIFDVENPENFSEVEELPSIQAELSKINITFDKWDNLTSLTDKKDLSDEEILKLYQDKVDLIKKKHGLQSVDIINVSPAFAQTDKFQPMRKKFLDEHLHTDDEVRYFIDGQGLFYIHHGKKIYGILCTAGDFISVPANTPHWFDMGSQPQFKCIRFFTTEEGWVPVYEKNSISGQFPLLDTFVKAAV